MGQEVCGDEDRYLIFNLVYQRKHFHSPENHREENLAQSVFSPYQRCRVKDSK